MKKFWIILLAIAAITIVVFVWNRDVVRYTYTYIGETELWTAELVGEGKWIFRDQGDFTNVKTDGYYQMTILYKGKLSDLNALDRFQVGYDAGSLGGSSLEIKGEWIDEKQFVFERFVGMEAGKDALVTVTVDMDEEVENFELKKVE
ncbi:hypothetical protein SANA_24360 [Gottschalkiaceae bacterium SANA]|nr:hypothetical protein SANA_24360 [Gottschalkiaceae bacterium SANA]